MEVETASARHRAAGNQLHRTALTFTHLGTRNGKLWKAREAYESAQKSARASADRAKATRNLGVVCAAQQEALPGNDAQLTIRYLVNAIVFGLGALTDAEACSAQWVKGLCAQLQGWAARLFAFLEQRAGSAAVTDGIVQCARLLNELLPLDVLHAQRLQVLLDLLRAAVAHAAVLEGQGDLRRSKQLLCDVEGLLATAETLAARCPEAAVDRGELRHLRERHGSAMALCQAHIDINNVALQVHEAVFEQEEADLSIAWACLDALTQNLCATRARNLDISDYAAIEAMTLSMLGQIWDRLLCRRPQAVKYYRQSFDTAMALRPQPTGEVWFQRMRDRMASLQREVTEQEERELDDLLRNIRPKMLELERLSKRVRDGSFSGREERALTFLEAVRDKLDLSEDLRRRLVIDEDRQAAKANIKKVVLKFVVALHPDKHMRGEGERKTEKIAALTRVVTYLNSVHEVFK